MLKKINRLSSFSLKNPKKITGELFSVKIAKNYTSLSRFGFVISKKLDKRAVTRNSLKRKLSHSVEEIFGKIDGGWDIVFYPRKEAFDAPVIKITDEIKKIFKKERILND